MKINEIINEGLLGWAARGLDRLGGGTGNIGSAETRQEQAQKQDLDRLFKAYAEVLRTQGIDINSDQSLSNKKNKVIEIAKKAIDGQLNPGNNARITKTLDAVYNKVLPGLNSAPSKNKIWDYFWNAARLVDQVKELEPKKGKQTATGPTPAAGQGLPPNVRVLAQNPIVLQVDKQRFELDNQNQWHYLGAPNKQLSSGQQAILNNYLKMI